MSAKSFKRVGEMQDGINALVRSFLLLARDAHKDVRRCKANGDNEGYWRYRSRRDNWIFSVRQVLLCTTNGVVTTTVTDRRSKLFWDKMEAKKAARLAKTSEVVG